MLGVLNDGEQILLLLPEPERDTRRGMLLAYVPMFAVLAPAILLASTEGPRRSAGDILGVWGSIALMIYLFIHWIRACRTGYAVTSERVLRFISDRMADEVRFAECHRPFLFDSQQSPSLILRWLARFMALRPMVRIARKVPLPLTFARFVIGNDLVGMRIGGPGRDLPTPEILEIATRAWDGRQSLPSPPG
ncbi:MAG TPA: hypothetical protein PLI43_16800 [Albidovulum sp.]|uniref:hypothetical protein n=1 Tax=Albidovulum sp. TaxID=1872424 RepID=UPI002CD349E6|nr:hypothetical protein [Albidovulum sp.]